MKEQQPWLLRQGSMQLMMLGAKHSDGRAFLLQWKHLAIGEERHKAFFSRLTTLLALHQGRSKSTVVRDIYGHLSISLVRSVARSIMGRSRDS